MVVYTHAPPYGGLYTCTTLWWSIHMHHLMVVYTHTYTTTWWSIHMHHLMVVYTHAPPYGGLYTCTTLWWSIHMHHLMVVYTHTPPYVTVHAERDHKSAILILRYGGVRQKRRILSFSFFRSGDAEGFIECSQLFQSC